MASNRRPASRSWQRLGDIDSASMMQTRLELHHAAQALAAFGQAMLKPREDDSHRSMTWELGRSSLVGEVTPDGLRTRLVVPTLQLQVERRGARLATLELNGRRPSEMLSWLGRVIEEAGEVRAAQIEWPEYDMPDRLGGADASFEPDPVTLGELSAWFEDAAGVLFEVFGDVPEASTIRCWPHHFDIATLMTYRPSDGGGEARYVGAGLSPGDKARPSPYYYVNGSPAPQLDQLPPLDGPGSWNMEGWIGAALDAEAIVALADAEEQEETVRAFLTAAVDAMRQSILDKA